MVCRAAAVDSLRCLLDLFEVSHLWYTWALHLINIQKVESTARVRLVAGKSYDSEAANLSVFFELGK